MGKAENEVEKHLDKCVKARGGVTRKYTSPSHSGVADRLVFIPFGLLWIVEVKTDVGTESGPQSRERQRMLDLGYRARIVYGKSDVNRLMVEIDAALENIRVIKSAITL